MKKLLVHTTATALLLSQLGMANSAFADTNETALPTDALKQEDPSLVKGDFLYFVKTTVEKIQLLLTTNKVKEAELLAEFAGERIHEARVLIKEGKEDLAKETIKEAVSKMEIAQKEVDVELPNVNDTTTDTTTSTTTDTTTTEDKEVTTEDKEVTTEDKEVTTEDKEVTTEDKETTTEDKETTTEDEKDEKETKKLTKEQKEIAKIQHHLNNNLLVLANVLDQVKNPKAKAAIANNIEKSFNKIADKLEKLMKNSEGNESVLTPVIEIKYPEGTTDTSKETTPEVITTITKIEDVEDADKNEVSEEEKTVEKNDEVVVAPTTTKKEHPNAEKKALKLVEKEEKKAKKEEKREVKRVEKEEKRAAKEVKKEEKHNEKRGNAAHHENHGKHQEKENGGHHGNDNKKDK
jgi:Domain of unknown function (DUF5667)